MFHQVYESSSATIFQVCQYSLFIFSFPESLVYLEKNTIYFELNYKASIFNSSTKYVSEKYTMQDKPTSQYVFVLNIRFSRTHSNYFQTDYSFGRPLFDESLELLLLFDQINKEYADDAKFSAPLADYKLILKVYNLIIGFNDNDLVYFQSRLEKIYNQLVNCLDFYHPILCTMLIGLLRYEVRIKLPRLLWRGMG